MMRSIQEDTLPEIIGEGKRQLMFNEGHTAHQLSKLSDEKDNYPKHVVGFDCETHQTTLDGEFTNNALTLGWLAYENMETGQTANIEFTTIEEFYTHIEEMAETLEEVYIIAHNLGYDGNTTKFPTEMPKRGWTSQQIIIPVGMGPMWAEYTKNIPQYFNNGKRKKNDKTISIIFCDSTNWWGTQPLKDIGTSLGHYKGEVNPMEERYQKAQPGTQDWDDLSKYCLQDSRIVVEAMKVFWGFCKSNGLGPFQISLAGQAFGAFRTRFMNHELYVHDNLKDARLESAAYFGGYTDCFHVGEFTGEFLMGDFKSMYPSVMASKPFPTRIAERADLGMASKEEVVDFLTSALEDYGIIGEFKVYIPKGSLPCAPVVREGALVYQTGEFWTTMCGPELQIALDRGYIVGARQVNLYEMADQVFTDYVDFFYDIKENPPTPAWKSVAKLFLNALYGKFGQRTDKWIPMDTDPTPYEEGWTDGEVIDDKIIDYRKMNGRIEMKIHDHAYIGSNSIISVAAYATSYARAKMMNAINAVGRQNAIYCDTDSLIFKKSALPLLVEAGIWKDEPLLGDMGDDLKGKIIDRVKICAPKDYALFSEGELIKERIKGIRKTAERGYVIDGLFLSDPNGDTYRQTQFESINASINRDTLGKNRTRIVYKTPTHLYNKGIVNPDGTVTPFHAGG